MNNFVALLITFSVALAWLRLNDYLAHRGWVSSQVSRKIIHMGTGPLFVLCWLLYPETPWGRYLAALVPLSITVQFFLVGMGWWRDEAAVKAMSRTGNPREILRGPLYYGIIFVLATLIYWRDSPIGIIALMLMCGGDGLADIVGRRFGQAKLPWSLRKSWVGSLGMFLGGWGFALGIAWVFQSQGLWTSSPAETLLPITLIALAATVVETLPFSDIDNLTVTLTAVLLGSWLL